MTQSKVQQSISSSPLSTGNRQRPLPGKNTSDRGEAQSWWYRSGAKCASRGGSVKRLVRTFRSKVSRKWAVAWPNEDMARMVKAYDPKQEVVFVFLRLDGGASSYRDGRV